jgi:predicted nucleotidyltransferase
MKLVSEEERQTILNVFAKRLPGTEVMAFGSRVHGGAKRWSDLDLAIMTGAPISPETMTLIRLDLSESDLPWRVDLIDWAQANESFRQAVSGDLTPLD